MKRQIRYSLVMGMVLGAFCFLSISGAVAATVWDMATPYPDGNFHTKNIVMFAQEIEKETGGKYKIKVHSNASLLKIPEIKRCVLSSQALLGDILLSAY